MFFIEIENDPLNEKIKLCLLYKNLYFIFLCFHSDFTLFKSRKPNPYISNQIFSTDDHM